MLKDRWLLYTVIIGLIPVLCRLCLFFIIRSATADSILNESDFIGLGLVLNLANLNEIEGKEYLNEQWVLRRRALSVFLILFLAVLLTLSMLQGILSGEPAKPDIINLFILKVISIVICIASLIYGYATFEHMHKFKLKDE